MIEGVGELARPRRSATYGRSLEPAPAQELMSATGSSEVSLVSVLKCPTCGGEAEETMPGNACQFFYECRACGTLLRPKPGDCCVFCSYGSVACPPVQAEGKRCC